MSLLGAIAKAVAKAVSSAAKNSSSSSGGSSSSGSKSSSGSSGSSGRTSVSGYSQNYEYDRSGNIYKNGTLVPTSNHKYIPTNIIDAAKKASSSGGTSSGGAPSGGATSQTIGSHTYSYDSGGNIYKNGNYVSPESYKYVPTTIVDSASKARQPDYLSGIGSMINAGANWLGNVVNNQAGQAGMAEQPEPEYPPYPEYPMTEIPYGYELESIIGELQDLASGSYDAGSAALINQAYNDTIAQIDAAQAELMAQMNDQMSGVDPATMASLKAIRDSVENNRQGLMEEMSQRGLLQSGIWLDQENKLNTAQANAESSLLATRLQDLQTQLNQALSNFGAMRVSAASNKSAQELQAMQEEAARRQNSLQSGLQAALNLYKYNQDYTLNTMPYYMQTVDSMRDDNLRTEELYGQAADWSRSGSSGGSGGSPSSDLVSVREYASTYPGARVEWDKNTQSVIINGQRIEAPDIRDGRAYVDRATLDRILGGR